MPSKQRFVNVTGIRLTKKKKAREYFCIFFQILVLCKMFLKNISINVVAICFLILYTRNVCGEKEENEIPERYSIATFSWDEVNLPLIIAVWLLVAAVAKIGLC